MDKKSIQFLKKVYNVQCIDNQDYIHLAALHKRSHTSKKKEFHSITFKYRQDKFDKDLKKALQNYPADKFDLYWSPMSYKTKRRKLKDDDPKSPTYGEVIGNKTKFLVQDIDEFKGALTNEPRPSYYWESSPGKYQGIWELERYIDPQDYEKYNKPLAKFIGCDDCHDFPHVYRIPGTLNHKYNNSPKVGNVKKTGKMYKPTKLEKLFKKQNDNNESVNDNLSNLTERQIYAKYSIPLKVRKLLALTDDKGIDRSATIWYIENKLNDIGMQPQEIILLIKNSVFNKYKGRSDEDKRLKEELTKILKSEIDNTIDLNDNPTRLRFSDYKSLMESTDDFPGWLVKGFWPKMSNGIIAGMPKTFKSTIVHDFAVSVASGKPFLDRFPVISPGPVLMIQNENTDYIIKDRTAKVIESRSEPGITKKKNKYTVRIPNADIPLYFINNQNFQLDDEQDREELIDKIEEIKPIVIIFDSLYLMFKGDLNASSELNPVLSFLLDLKNKYKTSIMVIHHYNKGGVSSEKKGGTRITGSISLYGWLESAWYLSKDSDFEQTEYIDLDESSVKPVTLTLDREFRMSGNYPPIDISLDMGQIGESKYNVSVKMSDMSAGMNRKVDDLILIYLAKKPSSQEELFKRITASASSIIKALSKLEGDGVIVNVGGKYKLTKGDYKDVTRNR